MVRWGVLLALVASCVRSGEVVCSDGTICAEGTTCDIEHGQCLTPDQRTSCLDKQEGEVCPIPNALGICRDGLCLGVACGDGLVQGSEQCDGAPPDFTCFDQGYDAGYLDCLPEVCAPAFSDCQRIGWKSAAAPGTGAVLSMSGAGTVGFAARGIDVLRYRNNVWEPMTLPGGGGDSVLSVFAADSDHAFAATEGALFRFDGTAWHRDLEIFTNRASVVGTGTDDVYVFTEPSTGPQWDAQHFDGQAWSPLPPTPSSARIAWAGPTGVWISNGTTLWRSTTSGASWEVVTTPLVAVESMIGFGTTMFLGDNDAGMAKVARWDGASWQTFDISAELETLPLTTAVGLGGRSATDLYAYGRGSSIVVHFDGTDWQRAASVAPVTTIAPIGTLTFAGTSTGIARESPSSFADISSTLVRALPLGGTATWGHDCRDVYVALSSVSTADSSQILRYDGSTWSAEFEMAMTTVTGLFGTSDGAVYATTYDGDVLQRTGGGWSAIQTFPHALRGGWAADGGFVVVYGDDGWVHRFDGSWTSEQLTDRVSSIWGLAPDDLYAIRQRGANNGIVHFDGVQWSDVELPPDPNRNLSAIWGAGDDLIAVGRQGVALHREQGVWRTEPSMPYDDFTALHGSSGDDVFAIGVQGTIAHFDGVHWAPVRSSVTALRSVWTSENCTYVGAAYTQPSIHRLWRRTGW